MTCAKGPASCQCSLTDSATAAAAADLCIEPPSPGLSTLQDNSGVVLAATGCRQYIAGQRGMQSSATNTNKECSSQADCNQTF